MVTPIDLAIITVLGHEFEAVRCRLGALERVDFADEPLVYHRGTLQVAHSRYPYSLILVRIPDAGNVHAALALKGLLQRWEPKVVVLVGVSAGVPEVTALGDVVVSKTIVYYESGKVQPSHTEMRPKHVSVGPTFWNKAREAADLDWREDIRVAPPDGSAVRSAVHVGTIASGEHVVNSAAMMDELATHFRDLKAVAMEGYGVGAAAIDHHPQAEILEIRSVCDLGSRKSDEWQSFAADAAAAFALAFLATGPISPRSAAVSSAPPARAIGLQSFVALNFEEIRPALVSEHSTIKYSAIDLTRSFRSGQFSDPQIAVAKLMARDGPLATDLDAASTSTAIFGQVHIPLAALAGCYLTDRRALTLLDFHRETQSWSWPHVDGDPFPALTCEETPSAGAAEAIVRVAVSYPVAQELTEQLGLTSPHHVSLSVPEPQLGCMRSLAQVRAYAETFRAVLDRLASRSNCSVIHVLYAGPVSLAIALGQAVSLSIHPPVIFWNYRQRVYDWGINLHAAIEGRDAVVRPLLTSQGMLA